ncbi:MAG: MaoC family dehydratase [Filimonas sp.]|nr:MaoC family dehydratase [Filimonas sp.]
MDKVIIGSYQDFEKYIGKEIGTSDYLEITQEMINMFADATLDHQWIHTDPERAAVESPFKKTIAHGYLTIAVAPHLWHQIADVQNIKMMINYGIEKLKFGDAVTVGSSVRLMAKLGSLVNLRGITKCVLDVELQIKDNKRPAYSGQLLFLYHFIS